MVVIQGTLLLVCLVLLGNVLGHFLPMVPDALIQIALGLSLALVVNAQIPVATDWFMLLFIAPLLYNDGRHFPRRALWALRRQIVSNAVFLVFATMFVGGFIIHAMVPRIPLAAAVALGALLAPTDPIAVEGIAKRVHLPKKVLHLVAGESLINDASGLIGFKYGLAAALSGQFILGDAVKDFSYIAVVGALAGALCMVVINGLRRLLLKQGIGDPVVHTVLQLVTPFLIYLIAEEQFHASGVIAVVVAGLMTDSKSNPYMAALPKLKLVSTYAWDVLVYILNGLIFILLGLELPITMRATIMDVHISTWRAVGYVLVVYLTLIGLRFAWVYLSDAWRQHRLGQHQAHLLSAVLSAIAGARGIITIVGVLAIPTTLMTGSPFPERSLILFIGAGVTMLSLVVASVSLPLLARLLPQRQAQTATTEATHLNWQQAQDYVLRTAIRELKQAQRAEMPKPALDLIGEYQRQLRRLQLLTDGQHDKMPDVLRDELTIRWLGTKGELDAVHDMVANDTIQPHLAKMLDRRLRVKLADIAYMLRHNGHRTLMMRLRQWRGKLRHRVEFLKLARTQEASKAYRDAVKQTAKGALANINMALKSPAYKHRQFSKQVVSTQIVHYRNRIETVRALNHGGKASVYRIETQRLRMRAFTAERRAVHDLMDAERITPMMAQRLSSEVSYRENAVSLRLADAED